MKQIAINYKAATARTEKVLHTKESVKVAINDKKLAKLIKADINGTPIAENNFGEVGAGKKAWDAFKSVDFVASVEVQRSEELKQLKQHNAPEKVIANAEEKLAKKIPAQHGYQGELKLEYPQAPYSIWLKKSKADHKDASCMLMESLNAETWREDPKEEDTERGYFGIPTMKQEFDWLANDLNWAKKQRTQPQSFTGKYEFLSNMYLCSVILKTKDGELVFPSAENAFQAMKCKTRAEMEEFQYITPYEAKKRGAEVDLRSNWNEIKDKVMMAVLRAKFEDQELAIQLLNTEDMLLCEKNFWGDTYWGKSYTEVYHYYVDGKEVERKEYNKAFYSDAEILCSKRVEKKMLGENKLGKLLCQLRDEIKESHIYDLYLHGYAEQADINVDWIGRG